MRAVIAISSAAVLVLLCACGPDGDEEELRCAPAAVDFVAPDRAMAGPCFAQMDRELDGTFDLYERWVYNAAGDPTRIEVAGEDGPKVRFYFGYDVEGRATYRLQEDAASGAISHRWDREYASPSVAISTSTGIDGAVLDVSRIEFDARGEIVLIITDDDLDGKTDSRLVVRYDRDGRPLEEVTEENGDVWIPWHTRGYDYDASGFLVETHYDYQRASETQHDSITHHTNDAWGNELVAEHIDLEDGSRSCTYNEYVCDE